VRKASPVDAMLFGAVVLWALNITVTKYMFQHGWHPLAYATIRYSAAIALFWAFTYWRERSFRIARGDIWLVALAGLMIFGNQISFVYGVEYANASTVALLLGTTPMFIGLLSLLFRLERLNAPFWIGAGLTLAGVVLIAAGGGGGFAADLKGDVFAIAAALTWAGYTITIAPLMRRYSPYRISALVLLIGWVGFAAVGIPQTGSQEFSFGWLVWLGFAFAVVGPIFLTNILWFTAVDRVGAGRASLFANLQPFVSVFFALILLSESLQPLEIVGGVLIFGGILLDRIWHKPVPPAPPAD
jgi:drug/metabolite transporter (DMT)-like permease